MKYFLLLFTSIFSCLQPNTKEVSTPKEKIISIFISTYGGDMGYLQSLKITADSLYFNFSLSVDSTKKKNQTKVNGHYKLDDLIEKSLLVNFSKLTDGESRQPVDGTDTQIIINTDQHIYAVINNEGDYIWQKLQISLYEIINKEFKDSNKIK